MLSSFHWFVVTAVLAAVLALIAIAAPRRRRLKIGSLAVSALFLPLVYMVANDLMSRPKPLHLEGALQHLESASVVASLAREDEAIYLWLKFENIDEPRAYQLPWDEQTAVELHEAQRQAEQEGTEVQVRQPFATERREGDPVFYSEPPQPLPLKAQVENKPVVVQSASANE